MVVRYFLVLKYTLHGAAGLARRTAVDVGKLLPGSFVAALDRLETIMERLRGGLYDGHTQRLQPGAFVYHQ